MPTFSVSAMTIASTVTRGRVAGGLTASIFLGHFLSPLASQPLIAAAGYAAAFRDLGAVAAAMSLCALAATLYRRRTRSLPAAQSEFS
jgi:hypothetical protein